MNYIKIAMPLFCVLLMGCEASNNQVVTDKRDHPNNLFIISDDHAWPDYSFMGHPHIQTPNIDNLTYESLTFTRSSMQKNFGIDAYRTLPASKWCDWQ